MDRPSGGVLLTVSVISLYATTSAFDDTGRTVTRVRGATTDLHRLVLEGDARAPTFRALVDEIHASNAIVIVQFGMCAGGRFRSCVAGVAGSARQRSVRIIVNTRMVHDHLIATIAHELQHAVEILRDPDARDRRTVLALYRRIGNGKCRQGLSAFCETDAAAAVEKRVLEELYRRAEQE
jgi:hypothetical protein